MGERLIGDAVHHPSYYCKGGMECIDVIRAATCNLVGIEAVCTANAIKYLWRWREKNGIQDLEKAREYMDILIREVEDAERGNAPAGAQAQRSDV